MAMRELSKQDYRAAKDVLRVGILRLHEQWQRRLGDLLARPYEDNDNAFDRSMEITTMARDWFKEANSMERWYDRMFVTGYIARFLEDGTLRESEVGHLSDDVMAEIDFYRQQWRRDK